MDLIKLLQEGDATGLEMQKALDALEHAKKAVEQAKERFDLTKNYFEQVIAKADEAGIPRAKFKKLVEERVAVLWNSGLLDQADEKAAKPVKVARPAKKKKDEVAEFSEADLAGSDADDVGHGVGHESETVAESAMMN